MRGVVRAVAFALAAALAGCNAVHDLTHPAFVSGKQAQAWVDAEAGAMIAARHPGLRVGHAQCPYLLNVSGTRTARCTIPVGDAQLRIDVEHSPTWTLSDVDAVVVKREANREVAEHLTERYGMPFTARCDGPEVQVIPVGGSVVCAVDAPVALYVNRIKVHVLGRDGPLEPAEIPSAGSRVERLLGRDVAEKRSGGITVAGPRVERYLRAIAGGIHHAELVQRRLIGAAHCPRTIVLGGSAHASCTVQAGDVPIRYDLRFDEGRGLVVEEPTIVVAPELREIAERYFAAWLKATGKRGNVALDCGAHPVVVVDPGSVVPCTGQIGDDRGEIDARVTDENGNVTFMPLQNG